MINISCLSNILLLEFLGVVVFFFVDKSLIPNEAILHEGVNAKFLTIQ